MIEGFESSALCYTIEKGKPIAMFGVNAKSLLGHKGVVWLLASCELDGIKVAFLRYYRKYIDMMLERYGYLHNYCDARNKKTVKWLKYMGARVDEAKPYGVDSLPFHYFVFER